MSAVATLSDEQLFDWGGWRIPFLAGFVLVLIGLAIRLGVEESEQFQQIKDAGGETARLPIRDVFARAKKSLAIGIGLQASVNVVFYIISVYFLSYATKSLGLERNTALLMVMIAAVIDLAALPYLASLSDRIGAHRIFIAGIIFTTLAAFPFFWLLRGEHTVLTGAVIVVMMVGAHATTYSVVSSLIADQFDTKVRYSGTALSNALGGLLFSAPTPFIAEAIVGNGGSTWWPLALMIIIASGVSLVAIVVAPQDHHVAHKPDNDLVPSTARSTTPRLTNPQQLEGPS